MIDSHCHLHYDYAPKTAEDLVREAALAGVTDLVTVGTDMETLDAVVALSEKFPNVYHTVGVHPHDAEKMKDGDLARLELASRHPKCRAIGEIGLDYHYEHSPRQLQQDRLREQLDLARKVGLPVVIHSREAEDDLLRLLKEYVAKLGAGKIPGVIHCFTGTRAFGLACLDLGFYISFSGILTFKKAEDLHENAKLFPLERLLIETDSPYLAPIPFRGKKCEPSMIKMTALKLAELKGVSFEEVVRVTSQNSRTIFGI